MSNEPVSPEIAIALSRFFYGGKGPRHSQLTAVFRGTGFEDDAPYDAATAGLNKEERIRAALTAAVRRPARAGQLVDGLLSLMRAHGCFSSDHEGFEASAVASLQRAFRRMGFSLSDSGELTRVVPLEFSTGGRLALDEQLTRLRRADGDPALEVGTAKDLLEAVAKFVLAEMDWPIRAQASFPELWHHARERLGVLPEQMQIDVPGGPQARKIAQSAWAIAEQVNEIRGLQGTGHGRTLPAGITPDMARLVVREACMVAEFALTTLDRLTGHKQ